MDSGSARTTLLVILLKPDLSLSDCFVEELYQFEVCFVSFIIMRGTLPKDDDGTLDLIRARLSLRPFTLPVPG